MTIQKTVFGLILSAALAFPAIAEKPARPGFQDARIRTVTFASRDVVRINGHYGFTTAIELAPYETIETVSIGDSEAWQVVKPPQPNYLFIKPLEPNADTNMTVITDKRLYTFILYADQADHHNDPGLTFHVRFVYPEDEEQVFQYAQISLQQEQDRLLQTVASVETANPEDWNFNYAYDGSESLRPTRVFDDGKFTYFSFPEHLEVPAIFLVGEGREESLVNFQRKGQYIVVERLGKQFTLRAGESSTCIFNQAFPDTEFDSQSPQRLVRNRGLGRLFSRGASNPEDQTPTSVVPVSGPRIDGTETQAAAIELVKLGETGSDE